MQPDPRFIDDTGKIWTYVKLLSGELGYSKRGENTLRTYTMQDLAEAMIWRNLSTEDIGTPGAPTRLGEQVLDYLNFRAMILETLVRPNLMSRDQAKIEFERLLSTLTPECTLPMNKQKGEKRHYAYLTCMVNMLTEIALGGAYFDYDPRSLITITKDGRPVRTLSRWMDGVFPNIDNPVAIWEIKEYYGTTTFGSRVADGIYETMLDGLELTELKQKEQIHVRHYLIVDDYYTWWECGKSYLCRIIDMLHMQLIDEVLFGREILSRWPGIVRSWPEYSPG